MGQASEQSVQGSLWKVWWRGRDQVLQRSTSWSTVHHWEGCCKKLMEGYTLWEFHKRGSTLGGGRGLVYGQWVHFLSQSSLGRWHLPTVDWPKIPAHRWEVLWKAKCPVGTEGWAWPHQHRKPREKYQPLDEDWPVITSLWNPSTQYVMNKALAFCFFNCFIDICTWHIFKV